MNGVAHSTNDRIVPEPELVVKAQHGDREAFGELFIRYYEGVYGIAILRLRNSADADDLVAEVFAHAMVKIDQLREPRAIASWLKSMTVRLSLNKVLRTKRHASFDEDLASNVRSARCDSTQVSMAIKTEQCELLRAALDDLRPIDREILEHFYFEESSLIQISELLDIPIGTAKRRLFVARNRLREQLERESPYELYR